MKDLNVLTTPVECLMAYSYIFFLFVRNSILIVSSKKKIITWNSNQPSMWLWLIKFAFLYSPSWIYSIVSSLHLVSTRGFSIYAYFSSLPKGLYCYSLRKFNINLMKNTRLPTILPGIDDLVLVNRDWNTAVYRFRWLRSIPVSRGKRHSGTPRTGGTRKACRSKPH